MPPAEVSLTAGRTRQKARTRAALVDALRALLAQGADPSVADVAAAARISRTTAYRYFPDQRALLHAALPETGARTLLDDDAGTDPVARLDLALTRHFEFLRRWEPQLRAALRSALQPGAPPALLRGGRAVVWYADALAPLAHTHPDLDIHDLAVRVRAVAGVEPYVWLTGVAGLAPGAACELMRANAMAILAQVGAQASQQRPHRRRRPE